MGARNHECGVDGRSGHLRGMARNRDDDPGRERNALETLYQPQDRLIASSEECEMPFINVKVLEGVFTVEQKREIAERLSETMIDIEGESTVARSQPRVQA